MIAAPEERVILGAERLEQLRQRAGPSELDEQILRAVEQAPDVKILVFRSGLPGEEAFWRFDPSLGAEDLLELAYLMLKSQLELCRDLVELGVVAMVHAELRAYEREALAEAVDRLLEENDSAHPYARLDRRILVDLYTFLTVPAQRVLTRVLPTAMSSLELRRLRTSTLSSTDLSRAAVLATNEPKEEPLPPTAPFSSATSGTVHLSLWTDIASPDDVAALHRELEQTAIRAGCVDVVLVVEDGVGVSPRDSRARAHEMLVQLGAQVRSVNIVLRGDGLWVVGTRAMFWGMAVVLRPRFAWAVVGDFAAADERLRRHGTVVSVAELARRARPEALAA